MAPQSQVGNGRVLVGAPKGGLRVVRYMVASEGFEKWLRMGKSSSLISIYDIYDIYILYRYIWVNYNDLTVLPHWNHG